MRLTGRPAGALFVRTLLYCGALASPLVLAHSTLRDFVQHRIDVKVGSENVDVTVELIFNEGCAELERMQMDTDGDGRISGEEGRRYLESKTGDLSGRLLLQANGKPVTLIPLFDPTLDLRGNDEVTAYPYVVTLQYFVRTPTPDGDALVLKLVDTLWPEHDSLRALDAEGTGGVRVRALSSREAGVWRISCWTDRAVRAAID